VSSILDALKKLEHEHSHSGETRAWPEQTGSRPTLRRWEIHSGRFSVILWGVLAAVIVVAGGWGLVYWRGGEIHPPETAPEVAAPSGMPDPMAGPRAQSAVSVSAANSTAAGRPKRPLPAYSQKTVEPAAVKKAPAPAQNESKPQSGTVPASPASESAPPEMLTEGFQLQAISWSERTEDRMAVVNGKIVREGTVLDGYKITRIDPEEVIVSKAERRWRLVFVSR